MGNYYYTTFHDRHESHNDNVVLLGPTEYLEDGGQLYYSYAEWLITRSFGALISLSSGKQLTIGGNFGGVHPYNLELYGYDIQQDINSADCVNSPISLVSWSDSGILYHAAETGAYLENRCVDSKISLFVKNTFNDVDYFAPFHVASADFSAYGYSATTLNVRGNVEGTLTALASDAYASGYTVPGSDGKPTAVDSCNGSTGGAIGYKTTNLIFENIFDQKIVVESSNNTFITFVKNSITGLTFKANGISASGTLTAENGEFSGEFVVSVSGNRLNAEYTNLPRDDKGEYQKTAATISGNKFEAIGVNAGNMTVQSITGSYFIMMTDNIIEASANSDPEKPLYSTVGGNTLYAAGIKVDGTLTVNDSFEADIYVETSNNSIAIFKAPETKSEHTNDLSSYGVVANKIVSQNGFGGTIKLEQFGNFNASYNYFEIGECFAVKADELDVSNGYITTNITATSFEEFTPVIEMKDTVIGISASKINTLAYLGTITVEDHYGRSCGIRVSNLQNAYDDMFDIAGNIYSYGGDAFSSSTKLNLRVSGHIIGDIVSSSSATTVNDYVEIAAGAVITGNVKLKAGQNRILVDSNARIEGDLGAELGTINIEFVLNDNSIYGFSQLAQIYADTGASRDAIITTVGNDMSLQSVSTITVNLNDASVGQDYVLFDCGTLDLSKWMEREIAVTYQGLNGHFKLGGTDGVSNETEFSMSDGATSASVKVRCTNDGKVVLVVTDLTASSLIAVQAPSDIDSVYDSEKRSLTVSWEVDDTIELYELEYRINGSKSITVVMDRAAMKKYTVVDDNGNEYINFAFDNLTENDSLEWRVRSHKARNAIYSDWSNTLKFKNGAMEIPAAPSSIVNAKATNEETGSLTASVATLTWDHAVCPGGLSHYEIRYYQDLDEESTWENIAGKTILTKYASSNELIVSGFANQQFVHWQVRAVDINGNAGEWVDGELFRVYVGDTGAPTLDNNGVKDPVYSNWTYSVLNDGSVESFKDITLTWTPAVDTDNKSMVGGYRLSYKNIKDPNSDWISLFLDNNTINVDGYEVMQKTITVQNGENYEYQWKLEAFDFAGNYSNAYTTGPNWTSDFLAPEFSKLTATQSLDPKNGGIQVKLEWTATDKGTPVSGIQRYVIIFDEKSNLAPVELDASKSSYTLKTWEKNLADGSYTWRIEAYDNAGNKFVSPDKTFKVINDNDNPFFVSENLLAITRVREDGVCEVTFNWDPASDKTSGIDKYVVEFSNTELNISGSFEVYSGENPDERMTVTKTLQELGLTEDDIATFNWWVKAYDFVGKECVSGESTFLISNDNIAPQFTYGAGLDSLTVSNNNGSCDVYFGWNFAEEIETDEVKQEGMKQYLLCFVDGKGVTQQIACTDLSITETMINSVDYTLPDGVYNWWIVAEDAVGNQTITESSTFVIDTVAPKGTISKMEEPVITVVDGYTGGSSDTIFNGAGFDSDLLSSVSLKFTCASNHTDSLSDVQYYWEFSKNQSFSSGETFSFVTETPTITFDDNNLYSAGLFLLNPGKFHWRVQACDSVGNMTGIWNVGTPFSFVEPEYGNYILDTGAPKGVSAISIFETKSLSTQAYNLLFSWTPGSDVFGVKEYEIVLRDSAGRTYTYLSNGQESYKLVDLEAGETLYECQFLLPGNLPQGIYSYSIQAIDYVGRRSEVLYSDEPIVYDYTDPVFSADHISVSHYNNDLYISWTPGTDNIGISHYEIQYSYCNKAGKEISNATVTVDGSKNDFWLRNIYEGHYKISMRAHDKSSNESEWTEPVQYYLTNKDVPDTAPYALNMDWNTLVVNDVGLEDKSDFYKYKAASAGNVKIFVGGVTAVSEGFTSLYVTVYDNEMNFLTAFYAAPGADQNISLNLTNPGDLYIQVAPTNSAIYTKYTIGAFGGSDESVAVYHDQTLIKTGATIENMTLNERNTMFIYDQGTAIGTVVTNKSKMYVSSGGYANQTQILNDGSVYALDGATVSSTVMQDGKLEVAAGAIVTDTTVGILAEVYVKTGGVIENTIVNDSGEVMVSSGGMAVNTIVNANGNLHAYNGAVVEGTTVNKDGYLGIGNGAVALNTEIGNMGEVTVWGGGLVNSSTINANGAIILSSGAAANDTMIKTNGALHVFNGATANGTTVDQGAFMGIGYGATANDTTIAEYGALTVWGGGVVNGNNINEWGAIILSSGAVANETVVEANGGLHIFDGAVAYTTEIESGAHLGIGYNGQLYNVDQNVGATITFYDGAKLGGWNDLEGTVLTSGGVDAMNSFINFELAERSADQAAILDNMGNFYNVQRYSVEVAEDQAAGTYNLAGGADNFSGGVTLYVGDGFDCGTLAVGATINHNGFDYTLNKNGGTLVLQIS